MKLKDIKITYEDWRYTASYKDSLWTLTTDWKTLDELLVNLKEALQLHYWKTPNRMTVNFSDFILRLSSADYASHLQTS